MAGGGGYGTVCVFVIAKDTVAALGPNPGRASQQRMKQPNERHNFWITAAVLLGAAALVAGCSAPPSAPGTSSPQALQVVPGKLRPLSQISAADTQLAYRHDAATHLYDMNSDRIYKGILPMFLYAVAVLQVEVDSRGQLTALTWMREPLHAPEVVAEIERTVRQAAPFPAPVKMGRATYIDTWLWDASGRFQLHTLTEGQSWTMTGITQELPLGQ
jgi:periplasmic protein TonB